MEFVDAEGNIVVPKAVRPIVGLEETLLGTKRGAARQYRHGRLHVRDYDSHYTVHMDRVDPRTSPVGHLVADAPEYVVGAAAAVAVGRAVFSSRRKSGKKAGAAAVDAVIAGCMAGAAASRLAKAATESRKKAG